MKKYFTFFVFLTLTISAFPQASTYFPAQTGFEWKFKVTPRDSANNPVESESFFRIDLFSSTATYKGQTDTRIIESKVGQLISIQQQSFTDSSFFYPNGSDGYVYLSSKNVEDFLTTLDQTGTIPNFSFVKFFTSLQNWYSTFRFASPVGAEYIIVQKDTSVTIGIFSIPLQFKYVGTRLADETIQTVNGNYTCKKFLIQWIISSAFLGGDIITLNFTDWIAQENWIVQEIMPGQYINNPTLTTLGIPPFAIPGYEIKLTDQLTSVVSETKIPTSIELEQNFPNPFNPTTKIVFSIPQRSNVRLIVYNLLGNQVAELVNSDMEAGSYETNFDASLLPSGVYFYKLTAGNFVETKKMLLVK
jgi:hypothetical protein